VLSVYNGGQGESQVPRYTRGSVSRPVLQPETKTLSTWDLNTQKPHYTVEPRFTRLFSLQVSLCHTYPY